MVAISEKGRIQDRIKTALKNLRNTQITDFDMERLSKDKYIEPLKAIGYMYLHDFAKAYVEEKKAPRDKRKYEGKSAIVAINTFLSKNENSKLLIDKFIKEEYKALASENVTIGPSITMASAATYAKEKDIQNGNFGRTDVEIGLIEAAMSRNFEISQGEVIEFAKQYPLLAGIVAANDTWKAESKNISLLGLAGNKSKLREYQQLAMLQESIQNIAFDMNLDEKRKKSLLDGLNQKAHKMYNSGQLGIPKLSKAIPKDLTVRQVGDLQRRVEEGWSKAQEKLQEKVHKLVKQYANPPPFSEEYIEELKLNSKLLKSMGYEYMAVESPTRMGIMGDFNSYLKSQGIDKQDQKASERKGKYEAAEEIYERIREGQIKPMEIEPESILLQGVQPPAFAAVSKLLITGQTTDETTRFLDGTEAALNVQCGFSENKSKEIREELGKKYLFVAALLSGEETEYIKPMIIAGNLLGPKGEKEIIDGKEVEPKDEPLMKDLEKLLELERDAKKYFKDRSQEAEEIGAQEFIKNHKEELEKIQTAFEKLLEKHCKKMEGRGSLVAMGHEQIASGLEKLKEAQLEARNAATQSQSPEVEKAAEKHKPQGVTDEVFKQVQELRNQVRASQSETTQSKSTSRKRRLDMREGPSPRESPA